MGALSNLNSFAYHSTEVLICDVKLAILKTQRWFIGRRIAALKAELARRGSK